MSVNVHLAFISWGLLALALFAFRPPAKAVVATFVIGFLFLPNTGYDLPGLHTKLNIISVGGLFCSLLFHGKRWWRLRLGLVDLPMIVWCLCPYASARANGMILYDALSAVLENVLNWGIPYFIGRVYYTNVEELRDLTVGVVIGGVLYVPLCLWELRMSPQLHVITYGFYPHAFQQALRYGGYRPTVFLNHGLAVAIWMSCASLLAFWLWRSGTLRSLWGVPLAWLVPLLFLTTLLCKSLNAIVLLAIGCLVYFITKNLRTAVPILVLLTLSPLYMILRTTGAWSGESLINLTGETVNEERAGSLKFRMDHETTLLAKAMQQKVLGWSRWSRSRVHNEQGKDVSATDGIWVIAFGVNGLVGLISWTATILLPVIVLMRRCPVRLWSQRNIAPAGAWATLLCLHMIDNLFNAMVSPAFVLAAGGLMALRRQNIVLALKPTRVTSGQKTSFHPAPGVQLTTARSQRW